MGTTMEWEVALRSRQYHFNPTRSQLGLKENSFPSSFPSLACVNKHSGLQRKLVTDGARAQLLCRARLGSNHKTALTLPIS